MNRSWRRALVLTLSAFAVGAFLPGAAAQADDPPGCPGLYCLWTQGDFNGKRLVVDTRRVTNFPDFIKDKASSLKIRTDEDDPLVLYDRKNGEGESATFCGGSSNFPDLEKANNAFASGDVKTNGTC
jgi:hypothetical protein